MLEGPNIKMNSGRAKIQNRAGIKSVMPTINDRRTKNPTYACS